VLKECILNFILSRLLHIPNPDAGRPENRPPRLLAVQMRGSAKTRMITLHILIFLSRMTVHCLF